MEPIIYKLGAYKTPGVYKGAGGIYNGRGVYNSGYDGGNTDTAEIGGRTYNIVEMPDGNIWMCENLDYGLSGVYYNNDEQTYGWNGLKYGKLYTWDETVEAVDTISGWHLPSTGEWGSLATAVGGSSTAGTKLKSTTGWLSGNGDGSYGFEAFPAGYRASGSFNNLGLNANFWTATENSSSNAYYRYFSTGKSMYSGNGSKSNGYSIRLVKD